LQAALGGAYRVERELGGGGMSRVFLATDTQLDRQVVIKVLPPDLAAGLNVERFRREIQLAAKLQHPHIVPLLAAGSADGLLYYTMPFIEGESLRTKLTRQRELPVHEAIKILVDVADALAYAHAHGLVHRDIKPDNVLLTGKHAVVTDFGVSKALSSATGEASITSVGVALGTPAYMAPEQAAADPAMDHRADIYALGVVAFELLAGRPPFTGGSAQQVLAAHITEPAPSVSQARAAVPPALDLLIRRCLEKRPADRPQTAAELLGALEVMATPSGGMPPTGAISGVTTPAAPATRRRWRIGAGAVGVAALIGAGFFVFRGRASAGTMPTVAVLPFDNLGSDSGQGLADGLQDDILTQLTKIGALQVISRASVLEYRHTTKHLREVGKELGARALLEGQVQRAGQRLRVNVQLIDAQQDRQLWANTYDRDLTAQDIFSIQDSIAQNVAEALRVQLTPVEAAAIAEAPTSNLEALDYYHRGRELWTERGSTGPDTLTPRAFERAVALDPRFAAAWAGLAEARSWQIRQYIAYDTTGARQALDHAVALAADAPETQLARGYYDYYAKGDFGGALEHFRSVERARPSDAEAVAAVGYILRRQGKMDEALTHERRVMTLDPRDAGALWDIGGSYNQLRRWDDAREVLERALILVPDYEAVRGWLFQTYVGRGDTAGARTFAQESQGHEGQFAAETQQYVLAWYRRDYRDAFRIMLASHPRSGLERRGRIFDLASAAHAGGLPEGRLYADSLRAVSEAELRQLAGWPDIFGRLADLHGSLGFAYAFLGRFEDARREGAVAVQLNPISRDAVEGVRSAAQEAGICVLTGDRDGAIERLARLMSLPTTWGYYGPSLISAAVLRLDPLYDPLRADPRFRKLVGS